MKDKFVNGVTSWIETHHEIVDEISCRMRLGGDNLPNRVMLDKGTGGIYELGESLTDEFEKLNEGREWDGEYFDEIEKFCEEKLK